MYKRFKVIHLKFRFRQFSRKKYPKTFEANDLNYCPFKNMGFSDVLGRHTFLLCKKSCGVQPKVLAFPKIENPGKTLLS